MNGYLYKIGNWMFLIHFVLIIAGGGCDLIAIMRVQPVWGKF